MSTELKYPDIAITIETITPEVAAAMLQFNTNNRPLRSDTVTAYAKVMSSSDWTFTGESISFDAAGRLVNGQHRLSAVIKSGRTITVVVVRGVPNTAWAHTDAGAKRSTGDMLQHAGYTSPNQLAATASLALRFENNMIAAMSTAWPRDEVRREIEARTATYEAAISWARKARGIGLPPTATSAFYVLMEARGMVERAELWLDGLIAGVGLIAGDSRLAIRNWLVNSRRSAAPQCMAVLIFGWNADVDERPIKAMRAWAKGTPYPSISVAKASSPQGEKS